MWILEADGVRIPFQCLLFQVISELLLVAQLKLCAFRLNQLQRVIRAQSILIRPYLDVLVVEDVEVFLRMNNTHGKVYRVVELADVYGSLTQLLILHINVLHDVLVFAIPEQKEAVGDTVGKHQ